MSLAAIATPAKVPISIKSKPIKKREAPPAQKPQAPSASASVTTCKICGRVFTKSQQLGGHTSKAHPNESKVYQHKQQIRRERTERREALAEAKMLFRSQTGMDPRKFRSKITQMAKQIVLGKSASLA